MGLSFHFCIMGSGPTLGHRVSGGCAFRAAGERAPGGQAERGWRSRPQSLVRWCDSSPCKNGGKCWQTNALYRCECHSGWTGLYCDVPSVSCEVAARLQGNWPCPNPTTPGRRLPSEVRRWAV